MLANMYRWPAAPHLTIRVFHMRCDATIHPMGPFRVAPGGLLSAACWRHGDEAQAANPARIFAAGALREIGSRKIPHQRALQVARATRENTIAAQAFHFLSSSIGRNLRIATDPITSCEVNPAVAL